MNISSKFSLRYLFSKKNFNIINLVTIVSIFGIFVSSASMIIIMSGFNGLEDAINKVYQNKNTIIKISKIKGKSFSNSELDLNNIDKLENIKSISNVIEEVALISNGEKYTTCKIRGVDNSYLNVIDFNNSNVINGKIDLTKQFFILPNTIAYELNIYENNLQQYCTINSIQKDKNISLGSNPFKERKFEITNFYDLNNTKDKNVIYIPFNDAEKLLNFNNEVSYIILSLNDNKVDKAKQKLKTIIPNTFKLETVIDQNKLIYATIKNEKLSTFIILFFVLLISSFTMIATLIMLILDKEKDIFTLKFLGMENKNIKNIFVKFGILISIVGGIFGVIIGLLISYLQIKSGFIKVDNFGFEAFPVKINIDDTIFILLTIFFVGIISSYVPVNYIFRKMKNK